ncbi:MFS general substrate transporter [Peniophora sp. CONT]|nr:MFS general substrate transporter [Peniophora sp. CONT]
MSTNEAAPAYDDATPVVPSGKGEQPTMYRKVHWYRSTIMQILVIGGVFFCAPGMYNALSGLGAGGLATPYWANATAAAGYVFMAFMCIIGGIVVSKLGVRWSLLISSTGDIIYAGTLYVNSKYGTNWPLMLGSIISGCTDGLMYAIEGPIITAYPEPALRGRMLGLWVTLRNLAPIIGGAIIFGLNHSVSSTGAVSLETYLVLIGIMCAGPIISQLISSPEKVQRKDGVKIELRKTTLTETLSEFWKVISNKNMLLLAPLMFTSWFYGSYIGTLETIYYTVRTRSLMAFLIPCGDVAGGFLVGAFLDNKKISVAKRARISFCVLMGCNLLCWIWAAILTKQLADGNPEIDWTSGSWFGRSFPLFVLFDLVTMATQTMLYWLIGHLSSDFMTLSFMTGFLRGVECIGQAVAYGIKSSASSDWISIGFNIGFFIVSIPWAYLVVRKIGVEFNTDDISKLPHVDSISQSDAETGSLDEKEKA